MGKNSEAPIRVLVVDDEESNLRMVGSILRSQPEGFNAMSARNRQTVTALLA